jgi:CelD/BcsL family acetyltransferase involved in cellulose biosynthesis
LYGFLYNGVFYFYQAGFDPRFSEYGVGLVLMGLAIQRAIEEGAREYDLLHGAERYKFLWAREARELSRLELYPAGLRGSLWKTAWEWNREVRAMARKMLGMKPAATEVPVATEEGDTAYAAGRS